MSLDFNETTMVPQGTAIWESKSHPHETTFFTKAIHVYSVALSSHVYVANLDV